MTMARGKRGKARLMRAVFDALSAEYGVVPCPLDYKTPFQLMVCAILSAQCTDKKVNATSPALFARFPDAESMAAAEPAEVADIIRSIGLAGSKSKNIVASARRIVEEFDGEVPDEMDALTSLPGVGRKTANVVLWHAFGKPGFPADTHVIRLSNRIGFADNDNPVAIEKTVNESLPPEILGVFSLLLITHGRKTCQARKPRCGECVLAELCGFSGKIPQSAEKRQEKGRRRLTRPITRSNFA